MIILNSLIFCIVSFEKAFVSIFLHLITALLVPAVLVTPARCSIVSKHINKYFQQLELVAKKEFYSAIFLLRHLVLLTIFFSL